MLKKQDGVVWAGFIWLRIETNGGLSWTRDCIFGFHKMLGHSWGAEQLVASQEGLSSTELVTFIIFSFCGFFFGWGETESTWYVGHCLAYCTSPGWYMMMSVESSVEWGLAGRENLPQCHFAHHKSHMTWDRTRAAAVGSRRLTAWAMARPPFVVYFTMLSSSKSRSVEW
jgi:hypothetical protein